MLDLVNGLHCLRSEPGYRMSATNSIPIAIPSRGRVVSDSPRRQPPGCHRLLSTRGRRGVRGNVKPDP